MSSIPRHISNGVVAATTAVQIASGADGPINLTFSNVGVASETLVLTVSTGSGTARRIRRDVLATNEQLVITNLVLDPDQRLYAVTTNAAAVEYYAVSGTGGAFQAFAYDAKGALKNVNSGVVGDQTLTGNLSVGGTLAVGSTTLQTISDGDGTTNSIPSVQELGTTKALASVLLASFNTTNDTTVAPSLNFLKSGNAAINSNTAVAVDEVLGEVNWFGADGTDFKSAAGRIAVLVDAAVSAGDMPGRMVFSVTADGGETLTEAMRITSAQNVCVADNNALIVGAVTPQTAGAAYETQVIGTALADSSLMLGCWSTTDSTRSELAFVKSGNATPGSFTIVANAENIGGIVWYADDGVDYASKAASIEALVFAAPGVGDMAGILTFNTSTDGGETPVRRASIASEGWRLGLAGTTAGLLLVDGVTSGTITVKGAAAAGTWTFTLPPDAGAAGTQLQTDGAGVSTWAAAGSLRTVKNVLGSLADSAQDALDRILHRGVYAFTYKENAGPTTGDHTTVYHGVMADEYPEVMHHNGRIFSPISAFGETALAFKALFEKSERDEARIARLEAQLAGA